MIEPGQQILHYRLIEKIGEGGMGVVWKALDTTLQREVAIKFLPAGFAADPDRLTRFEREARLLATLQHPNIATAYGMHTIPGSTESGEADSSGANEIDLRFIVMELVEGETLAERLHRSRMSVEDTLEIVAQIADALETAHEQGVVHRDLKPANVKIRPDGTVKVLDFGLARAISTDSVSVTGPDLATATALAETRSGVILGTVPYMSPEQARGKPVDKRTDIWALGCLLYECLTGSRPFGGDTTTDVLAHIVSRPPDFDSLPPNVPGFLSHLVRRCLEKDSRKRLRDAGELRVAIEAFRSDPDSIPQGSTKAVGGLGPWFPWSIVVVLIAALAYLFITGGPDTATQARAVSRWKIPLPDVTRVDLPGPGGKFDYSNGVAISRDGKQIVFSVIDGQNQVQLYLKADSAEPQPIAGTTNARAPFFSPDGLWLGFYSDGTLWKVLLRGGGSPQEICDVGGRAIAFDAAWAPDGKTILFTDDGIWQVTVVDGVLHRLTKPDPKRGELGHHAPRFTANGQGVFFTVSGSGETHLARKQFGNPDWEIIIRNAAMGLPVGKDSIVFARSGELFVAPYDDRAHQVIGPAEPALQGIHTSPGLGGMVVTWFDISDSGTLLYVPAGAARPDERLVWVDFEGTESVIAEGPGTWVHPRISPDGARISLDIHSGGGMRDVYIYELERRQFQQLTHTGVTWESEWRPDGEYLAVLSGIQAGLWSLYQIRTDFSGSLESLVTTNHAVPGSWVDDGRALLYTEWNQGGVYRLQVDDSESAELIFSTKRRAGFPRVSPDGNWLAYVVDESSRREIFVQSYPQLGATHKVSIDGGREPVWSRDGRRLFYRKDNRMMAVDVDVTSSISFGQPEILFEGEYDAASVGHQHYDISLEDDRFLMVKHGIPEGPVEVRVVLNWAEELKSKS